ncbi:hypothetical protein JTE90_006492 [Oedothorax gibbosus]|uniref:Breast cancer type 2 susceptibility protein n=1 Tax=Oedothorax gibbosus TaxID=931172 RepID=A0AAV6VPN8_9ARAC|nr:hypothetical protein JTE90_006492 [Oedothorax gibbosus]
MFRYDKSAEQKTVDKWVYNVDSENPHTSNFGKTEVQNQQMCSMYNDIGKNSDSKNYSVCKFVEKNEGNEEMTSTSILWKMLNLCEVDCQIKDKLKCMSMRAVQEDAKIHLNQVLELKAITNIIFVNSTTYIPFTNNFSFPQFKLNETSVILEQFNNDHNSASSSFKNIETLHYNSIKKVQENFLGAIFPQDKQNNAIKNWERTSNKLNFPPKQSLLSKRIRSFPKLDLRIDNMYHLDLFCAELSLSFLKLQSSKSKSTQNNKRTFIGQEETNYRIEENFPGAKLQMYQKYEKDVNICHEYEEQFGIDDIPLFTADCLSNNNPTSMDINELKYKSFKQCNHDSQIESIDSETEMSSISELNIKRKDASIQTEINIFPDNFGEFQDLNVLVNSSSSGVLKSISNKESTKYLENSVMEIKVNMHCDECNYDEKIRENKVKLKERKLFSSKDSIELIEEDTYFTTDQLLQDTLVDQVVPSKKCLNQDLSPLEREPDLYSGAENKMCDSERERDKTKVRVGLSRKQKVRPLHPYLRN